MAHEIYTDDGRASMMYTGEVPWHKLGTRVESAATAEQAIQAANLDWKVTKLPLFASTGILGIPVEGKYAVVREDKIGKQDCPVYGIVGKSYSLLQNEDAFSFFDTIVKDKNAAIYHTAGALGKGERIWILAKLPNEIRVIGDDITEKYLLLSNSHDGKGSIQIKFTPIRVVCQNTLSMALSEGKTLRIPHAKDLEDRMKKANEMLGIIDERYKEIEEAFQAMTRVKVDRTRLEIYLNEVLPDPKETEAQKELKKAQDSRFFSEILFEQGKGNQMPGVPGTLWAAYNGVTEFIDHRVTTLNKNATISPSRRLNSIWFGEGSNIKIKAFTIATEKMKGEWKN